MRKAGATALAILVISMMAPLKLVTSGLAGVSGVTRGG